MSEEEFKWLRSMVTMILRRLADVWPPRPVPDASTDLSRVVEVTAAATGGGKYSGYKWTTEPTANISATGNLASSEIGTRGAACLIVNFQEMGKATHDITTAPQIVTHFVGRLIKTNSDGTEVIAINGSDWEACS